MSKPVKKPRKKATNGYKMPEPLPSGEILTDVSKKQWKLGNSIGKGGFGEIYSAQEFGSKSTKFPFVVKVEPHGNGPLFVEMHFYMKNAKQADVEAFMKKHKLKTFGMPIYLGSGSHEVGNLKYRFIVMEKFGSDVDKLRQENGPLTPSTVFQMAWQITYVLEYIHEFGYIHGDIKGGNVLLGCTPETRNQVYLVDFGLATKFTTEKEYKPNPKKAHDGTIEYTSRDAHQGVPTMRGDFEILGYNLIHWLGGTLPWESKLEDPKIVQQIKEDSLKDIPKFLKTCLKKNYETLSKYFNYVVGLKFNERPDYDKVRSMFKKEISKDLELQVQGTRKRRSVSEETIEENKKEVKKPVKKREIRQNEVEEESTGEVMTPAMKEILQKREKNVAVRKKDQVKKKVTENGNDNFEGYNAEMLEIQMKKNSREQNGAVPKEGRSLRNLRRRDYKELSGDTKKS